MGGFLLLSVLLPGCAQHAPSLHEPTAHAADRTPPEETLAAGVIHRSVPVGDGGIDLVDVDLSRAAVRPAVVARGIGREGDSIVGDAYTPGEWLTRTHALAAVNGGYFGQDYGDGRKEIVGLLVQRGRVRHAAPPLRGRGGTDLRAGRYVRSAFGVGPDGLPSITWAATEGSVAAYPGPTALRRPALWPVRDAVGCGPTLIRDGQVRVTDRAERLVSPGPRPRTFVAYDVPGGRPRHFVLGIASGLEYRDLAGWLAGYFPRYDATRAAAAMCLDGGSSTQFSCRRGDAVESPRDTGVTVPDAVVLLPRR